MRVTTWAAALLCGMALAVPVVAQEDAIPNDSPRATTAPEKKKMEFGDPPLHRWGGMTIVLAAWEPQLIGADEELATTYPNGVANPLMEGSTPHIRETVGAIYHLPSDAGSIGMTYDSMDQNDTVDYLSPGQFIFGETRAYPYAAGAFDDGFADGVTATLSRKTREFRFFYSQTAFENKIAKGTWSAGYRQVGHSRNIAISYLAIVPNLPPLIPPSLPDNTDPNRLNPLPDQVLQTANFAGHGLGASFDFEFSVHPRVAIITGLSVGLIRGSGSSAYSSQTSFYFQEPLSDVPLTPDQLFTILSTGTRDDIALVGQRLVFAGLNQPSTSQTAETFDIYLGVEVKVYRGLKLFATLRDVYYANVGEYVVPRPGLTNVRTPLTAGYEGYVFGLAWRF